MKKNRYKIKYYAYIPTEMGCEPVGTGNRMLFQRESNEGAIREAQSVLGDGFVLVSYSNLYDDKTYKTIRGEYISFEAAVKRQKAQLATA